MKFKSGFRHLHSAKMYLKISSAKQWPFCLGFNVLNNAGLVAWQIYASPSLDALRCDVPASVREVTYFTYVVCGQRQVESPAEIYFTWKAHHRDKTGMSTLSVLVQKVIRSGFSLKAWRWTSYLKVSVNEERMDVIGSQSKYIFRNYRGLVFILDVNFTILLRCIC